jgi:hypothetical protein
MGQINGASKIYPNQHQIASYSSIGASEETKTSKNFDSPKLKQDYKLADTKENIHQYFYGDLEKSQAVALHQSLQLQRRVARRRFS